MDRSAILVRNNVTVMGRRDGPAAMVFVHGFGTDQGSWARVAEAFAGEFRIVLLDNVGAGGTPAEAFVQHRYLNLDRYATDLLEVCDAVAVRDAVLVGHSAGAMIAVLAAIARPDVVSRLVLIGASPRYLDDAGYRGGFTPRVIEDIYRAVASNYHEWANQFAPQAMSNADRPHLAARFAAALKTIPAQRALTVLCSILQSDYRTVLPRVRQPVLLLQAAEDAFVPPEVARYMQRTIPHAELQVVRATGHFPHVSDPEAVIAAMRPFVAQENRT